MVAMAGVFDFLEEVGGGCWAARSPRRPVAGVDVRLTARVRDWESDEACVQALALIEAEPWVADVVRHGDGVQLSLNDEWIEAAGAALEAGAVSESGLSDIALGESFSVQFWDANATKALHVGHLRNLAIGNALAACLEQAGGGVERRSLISDAGRSMGEAMAGVLSSHRYETFSPNGQKSDHFVGACYSEYVACVDDRPESPEDSLSREAQVRDDIADELLKRVLAGDPEALELWFRTRAWVIAGQRKTLSRLGVAFDRVLFESDFLAEAKELTERGLAEGRLRRREDGVVVYPTGLEDLMEMPLVRADGIPTQHMRSLAYCAAVSELNDRVSMQVTGSEWVSHAASIRKLIDEWRPMGNGFHPNHSIFHGMVADQKGLVSSSAGSVLLVDDLVEWVQTQIDSDAAMREIRGAHPQPERMAAQIVLGYFLAYPVTPRIEFDMGKLLCSGESLGWDLVCARSVGGVAGVLRGDGLIGDPDYRFAVVQSELYRRHLRQAVERFDVVGLALYLRHLARWYLERPRSGHVERVVHTLLDRSAKGLGLEGF
jgi:arginyl-tRNA synthetase